MQSEEVLARLGLPELLLDADPERGHAEADGGLQVRRWLWGHAGSGGATLRRVPTLHSGV